MENADHTPRRHIGYHKGSKSHIPSFDRSSSCPSYASPSNYRTKIDKGKIDLFPHITNVIVFLKHNGIFDKDKDYIKPKHLLLVNNYDDSNAILKENIALMKENEKLMKSLADHDNNNDSNNDNNEINNNTINNYNNRDEYDYIHNQTNSLYKSLLQENHKLLKDLSKLKERNYGSNYCNSNSNNNNKNGLNFKKMFPCKKMGKLLNEVKSNMNKFITFYNSSEQSYHEYNDDDNDDNDATNTENNNYYPQRSHQQFHNNTYNFHDKEYAFFHNDNNPSNDHVFECDENANITNNDDDNTMDNNNDNVIITTEKFEKENGNEVVIALDRFKMTNKDTEMYSLPYKNKQQYQYQFPLHHSNTNIRPQNLKGSDNHYHNNIQGNTNNNKKSIYSNSNMNTNSNSNIHNLHKNDSNNNNRNNINIKSKTKINQTRFTNNNPIQHRRMNNHHS